MIAAGAAGLERATSANAAPSSGRGVPLVARCVLAGVAYYGGSVLGYALIFPSSYISTVWPPNAILAVALLLSPRRHWPWLLLATLPVHLFAQAQFGVSLAAAGLYYIYDCAAVTGTAAAWRRFGPRDFELSDLREAFSFIAVTTAALALTALVWSPLIAWWWTGGDLWRQWLLVFLSNLLPFLIAIPGLVIALTRGGRIVRNATRAQYVECALLTASLLICGLAVFGLPSRAATPPALFFAPLPLLLWAAVRLGPGGLSLSFAVFALVATFRAVSGDGPFVTSSAGDNVLLLQNYLLALYVPLLVLASVVMERRSKEEALGRSEARYRAVVEDQMELICRFLPDGTYTFVNGAYCRYFQHTPEELIGQRFWRFIPVEAHEAAREFLASITPACPVAMREHEVIAPDGEIRWQQWRDRGFFDASGAIVEYQAVGRDITDRKRAEEAMRGLAHAERLVLVGELTASIANEINQPLCAILSNADAAQRLLKSRTASLDEVRQILADIREDDLRASEVIRRVRDLLHKRELLMTPLDLNDVANEVVRLVASDARRCHVVLETELAPGLPPIHGDRVHLQQVLLNLILNGMEAMAETAREERRIVVRTDMNGDHAACVSVIDAGHGIPPDTLPSVFDSFFTTKEHGVGLGLAIARSIVEVHHGRIWALNNPGGGATFSFTVQLAATAAAP